MQRRAVRSLRKTIARCLGDAGPIPWIDGAVADLATRLGLAAVLDVALQRGWVATDTAPAFREDLTRAAAREQALVMAAEAEASRVVARLRGAGIECIALKGLVNNVEIHRPRGWCRAPGDVDLLVHADAAEAAQAAVAADPEYVFLDRGSDAFYASHHHTRPFVRRARGATPIELHRRISGVTTGSVVVEHDGCWQRSIPFPDLGPGARRLDDVDQCLATVLHLDRDDAYHARARQVLDLALWRERCADRMDELDARAREWKASSTVARAFRVVDAFLGRTTNGSSEELPSQPLLGLWQNLAVQLVTGSDSNAVPGWYLAGILRSLTHEPTPRSLARQIFVPLTRRFEPPD